MAQLIKRILNRINTSFCRIKGGKIGLRSSISYKTDITNCQNLNLDNNSTIYKNTTIYLYKNGSFKLGHDSHIASYGYFLIGGNFLEIGSNVAIGPFCSFFCLSNSYSNINTLFRENYINKDIKIGDNVFVGSHCVFLPGAVVEDNVIVAANSVIGGLLETGCVYGGSPVKKIKKLDFDNA